MKKIIFACLLFQILCISNAEAIHQNALRNLNGNNDHGIWLEQNFEKKINKEWEARLHLEQHISNDYHTFYYNQYEISLQRNIISFLHLSKNNILKKLSIGPTYQLTNLISKNTLGRWKWASTNNPMIDIFSTIEFCKWKIIQRTRAEYVTYTKNHYKEHAVGRHRIVIITPWSFTDYNITPYLSNEFFFRKNSYHISHPKGLVGGYYQNRFRVGVNFDIIKDKLSSALFWQWRINKGTPQSNPRWNYNYHYGLVFNVNF